MSFADLDFDEKCSRLTSAMQRIAAEEVMAVRKTPWLDARTAQVQKDAAKEAYQLVVKIVGDLKALPAVHHRMLLAAWDKERHLVSNYIAMVLRTTKAPDLRLARLRKMSGAVPRRRAEIEAVEQPGSTDADTAAKAQDILDGANQTIGFLEFTADNPRLLTEFASAVWNKTAAAIAQKLFGKTLSRLTAAQSIDLARAMAPLLTRAPGASALALKWLQRKGGGKFGEAKADFLGRHLFDDFENIRDPAVAKAWLETRVCSFVKTLGEYVGPATVLLDIVTVVLDTVDDVDRWASAFVRSAAIAYAAGGTALLLGTSLTSLGWTGLATGAVTAEMTAMEAALVSITSALSTSAATAAATSPALPVAAFCIVTGVVIAVGIVAELLIDVIVDCFFGPDHIPAQLRASYAMPISAPQRSVLAAPIAAA